MDRSEYIALYHAVTVAEMRQAISTLEDDDLLVPNQVSNIAVVRDDEFFAYVDLNQNARLVKVDC